MKRFILSVFAFAAVHLATSTAARAQHGHHGSSHHGHNHGHHHGHSHGHYGHGHYKPVQYYTVPRVNYYSPPCYAPPPCQTPPPCYAAAPVYAPPAPLATVPPPPQPGADVTKASLLSALAELLAASAAGTGR